MIIHTIELEKKL